MSLSTNSCFDGMGARVMGRLVRCCGCDAHFTARGYDQKPPLRRPQPGPASSKSERTKAHAKPCARLHAVGCALRRCALDGRK